MSLGRPLSIDYEFEQGWSICLLDYVCLTHHISMMGVFISRQVSRSPHSKHSQRRHSPYSSLDTNRYVAMTSFKLSYIFGTYPTQVKEQKASMFSDSNCQLP